MTTSATGTTDYPGRRYQPRHTTFPYTSSDFLRHDESSDNVFYSAPRFVTHIDDNAIALLQQYYLHNLPRTGRILDFCSSWISHFPKELEASAVATVKGENGQTGEGRLEVIGMGMSEKELAANTILSSRIVQDLNNSPSLPTSITNLDASTCVVSIDYLTNPLEVLQSIRERTRLEGTVHLVISNRCFPTKVIAAWLKTSEERRLDMVGDFLWFAGWRDIEILTLCDGKGDGGGWFGLGRTDPLWVVRGKNVESGYSKV